MGAPFSSLSFLLVIFKFFYWTWQKSSVLAPSVRSSRAQQASQNICDSGNDFSTTHPATRYRPGANQARHTRHRLRRRGASSPDADRTPPRPLSFIAAALFLRTQSGARFLPLGAPHDCRPVGFSSPRVRGAHWLTLVCLLHHHQLAICTQPLLMLGVTIMSVQPWGTWALRTAVGRLCSQELNGTSVRLSQRRSPEEEEDPRAPMKRLIFAQISLY
ncbi:hypothetical protein HPB48_003777 [Haemaphysalis longicornis]|uniref:Secreted protein n=1 Tax=Haemaphysalis longicornis TaxID=44386 RepID=A0A9J6F7D4_HAELO|nr:hypothetical protein HPB48_003777 [Haemaphysalis longicornis]